MKKFFNQSNPWAYQSITGRMLEAVRKGYWQAGEEVKKKLASEYAANVVDKGMACCDHTCNNPLLNQMVVNIISLPGVMSAEMVEEFKMALERATGMELAEQTAQRQALQDRLTESLQNKPEKTDKADSRAENAQKDTDQGGSKQGEQPEEVSGYKMEKEDSQDEASELSSSGVQWFATLALLGVVGLFGIGAWRRK
jgi:cobaltochelatase CobN